MKAFAKRGLSMLLALVLCLGLISVVSPLEAAAASYTYNWGTREDTADEADFTRSTAEEWYDKYSVTYEELSELNGSSSLASVPNSELYLELQRLMRSAHSTQTSYDATKSMYQYTDCQNGGGKISSFYSGNAIGPGWGEGGSWNREHTWPNSKGLGGKDETDIMMLRPTSTSENSSRGNTAYGESHYDPNSESGGKYNLHGDCARICLYVYVRWGNTNYMWGSSGVMESLNTLLKWMEEDPVDTWELGRNDAVESITGTRNIFVDYPELAFQMFGADVPANYQSPSGAGNATSYTITATSNNTSYGTVAVSGKTITATPKTGYYVSGYTVVSGTATVTQSGNTFKVSASSDCSIRINFAAKTSVTVKFMENGILTKTLNAYGGDTIVLPQNVNTPAEGYTFLGWSELLIPDTTTKPTVYAPGSNPTAADKTYYAVYTYAVGGTGVTEYALSATIKAGDTVVITNSKDGTVYALPNDAISKNPVPETVTAADGKLTGSVPDNLLWTVGGSADAWTFTAADGSDMLYCNNDNAGVAVGTGSNNTFKVSSDYLYNIGTSRYLGVYTNNPDWRCYTSASTNISGQTLGFYVLGAGGTVYYTTSTYTCEHEDISEVEEAEATCTEGGYTAGKYCNDCGQYIEGHVAIAPLGHDYTAVVTPPTATEQGYTTYTCENCGDSYTADYTEALGYVYTVSFSVPVTEAGIADMECGKNGITLPTATAPEGYTFAGWTTAAVEDTETAPTVYTGTYKAAADTTLYALYTYTVGGTGSTEYVLTDLADISETDEVVITMTKDTTVYVLPNNGGASSPAGQTITVSGDKLVTTPDSTLLWNVKADGTNYSFYVNGGTGTLYCTSTNSGVKIGTSTANVFTLDSTGYLKHTGTGRFLGVYTGKPDWRCYTSPTINIGGQTLGFYVKGLGGTTYYTTISCPHDTTDILPAVAATCTGTGLTEGLYCEDCGEVLVEQTVTSALGHSYADGACTVCGAADPDYTAKFDIDVARMILGNALEFQFGVRTTKIPDKTGYYAVVEKAWADGTTTTETIPAEQWGTAGTYHAIVYEGLAAKEMNDTISVTIYNAKGQAVSNAKQDSVVAYVTRAYASQTATGKTMMVDMLNYGAAAQVHFSYDTDNLCNAGLTDAQKAVATATTPEMSNDQVKGTNYQGTRFILESRIQVQLGFKALTTDMYAIYTYTNAAGAAQEVRVEGADFVENNGTKIGVELSALVYADARSLVSCTVYNADGTVYATASDSIESCSARSGATVFVELMKFADSAKAHLYG